MKKTYKIEVDCANCANLMEEATKKTAGVADATVNFMTQKMTLASLPNTPRRLPLQYTAALMPGCSHAAVSR